MIVVSGCPRSGTSLMMKIMAHGLGEDRLLAKQFPQEERPQPERNEIQQYLFEKSGRAEAISRRRERTRDMNPGGFYEMEFSVQGVFYRPPFEDLLNEILADSDPKVCKIVSQGLARSDPRFVTKVVFMARDPRAVAKSQERLGRDNPMDPESAPVRDGEKVLIRSVAMFNQVTVAAAHWLDRHPEIPVHVVNYDRLIENPDAELRPLEEFLGEGDFVTASSLIDHTLRRSAPEDLSGEEAAFAKAIFEHTKTGAWKKIVDAQKAKIEEHRLNPPKPTSWFCPRLSTGVSVDVCKLCKTHVYTTVNLINNAERKKIKWREEPCPYECGVDGSAGISVAESVAGNHWAALLQSTPGSLSIPIAPVSGSGSTA